MNCIFKPILFPLKELHFEETFIDEKHPEKSQDKVQVFICIQIIFLQLLKSISKISLFLFSVPSALLNLKASLQIIVLSLFWNHIYLVDQMVCRFCSC